MAKAKKSKKVTVVSLLLDATGSMMDIKDATVSGLNEYISNLKADKKNKYEFNLIEFNSSWTKKVFVAADIQEVPVIKDQDYVLAGLTPLIDACMKIILATEEAVKGRDVNVLVTFQTDGAENCSSQYTRADLALKIKEMEGKGWVFQYIGAGIDAYAEARKIGIADSHTVSYGREHSDAAFSTLSQTTMRYAGSGGNAMAAGFTTAERAAMGEGPNAPLLSKPEPKAKVELPAAKPPVFVDPNPKKSTVDDFSL